MSSRVSEPSTIPRAVSAPMFRTSLPTASSSSLAESPEAVAGEPNPSPMSVDPARALSRSRTCLRKSATTNPNTATGTVYRNTVCRACAYASITGAATAGSSWCTPSGVDAARASCSGSCPESRAASTYAASSPGPRWFA